MRNPMFHVFDGMGAGLNWVGKHGAEIFFFLCLTVLWLLPYGIGMIVAKSTTETGWSTWVILSSTTFSIFIMVNWVFWIMQKPLGDKDKDPNPASIILRGLLLGGCLQITMASVLQLMDRWVL